jgi:3-hydroxyisobutyrate dehydrogenase-like beta-hydroxyacid dehydrogenase
MKVGVIGLGQMGSGSAASLLRAGHEVTVYNRTRARVEPLLAQGARSADAVADACRGEAIVTMLSNDAAAQRVAFGEDGIIENLGGMSSRTAGWPLPVGGNLQCQGTSAHRSRLAGIRAGA